MIVDFSNLWFKCSMRYKLGIVLKIIIKVIAEIEEKTIYPSVEKGIAIPEGEFNINLLALSRYPFNFFTPGRIDVFNINVSNYPRYTAMNSIFHGKSSLWFS